MIRILPSAKAAIRVVIRFSNDDPQHSGARIHSLAHFCVFKSFTGTAGHIQAFEMKISSSTFEMEVRWKAFIEIYEIRTVPLFLNISDL